MPKFNENPPAKIKIDFQDKESGTKFSEEPFYLAFNVFNDSVIGGGYSTAGLVNDINECMTAVASLTGASVIAKHLVYDISITDEEE